MNKLKEVAAYCAANIVDWDAKCQFALTWMTIPNWFRNEIEEAVSEWCDYNEVSLDFFDDWEDIAKDIVFAKV